MPDEIEKKRQERIQRIEEQDKTILSPEDRARRILSIIREFDKEKDELTNWDLICFSLEYLKLSSLVYEWMRPPILRLNQLIYTAHYYLFHEIKKGEVPISESSDDNSILKFKDNV